MISCGHIDPKITATYPITRIFSKLEKDGYEPFIFSNFRSRNSNNFILKLQSSTTLLSFPKIFFSSLDNKPEAQVIACSPVETGTLTRGKRLCSSLSKLNPYLTRCGAFSRFHICISKGDTYPPFALSTIIHIENECP